MNQFVKEELLTLREPQGREKRHQKPGIRVKTLLSGGRGVGNIAYEYFYSYHLAHTLRYWYRGTIIAESSVKSENSKWIRLFS